MILFIHFTNHLLRRYAFAMLFMPLFLISFMSLPPGNYRNFKHIFSHLNNLINVTQNQA
jgi:hypothetical protein